ncbi:GNAT family N-acetyltransferase [Corynebacterium phocae]|nr:GNAT family N-acetyltransferase [Corynebacterium phocae]KAA8726972.1 N-acetyltransferase [Corynebacterium phocae]
MDIQVVHDKANSRYVLSAQGKEAGFAQYSDRTGVRDFFHTEVYPQFQGQGLSKPLIREALDSSRQAGLRVRPSCSAVEYFIEQNPRYGDLRV